MNAVLRVQLLREALGASADCTVDEMLAEIRRLRALDVRRVSHLAVSEAYANGIGAVEQHIRRELRTGCTRLDASDVLRWLACIEADAKETQAYAPRARATDAQNVFFLPGVQAQQARTAGGYQPLGDDRT